MHLTRIGPVSLQAPMWNARGPGAEWRNMKLKPGKLLCALTEVHLGEQIGGLWRCHPESGTVSLEWKH